LDEVRELLASSFRLALHQNLIPGADGRNELRANVLLDTISVVGAIRQRAVSLDNLKNDIVQQAALLKSNMPIELRPID
jgi:twitching motility protein PilT